MVGDVSAIVTGAIVLILPDEYRALCGSQQRSAELIIMPYYSDSECGRWRRTKGGCLCERGSPLQKKGRGNANACADARYGVRRESNRLGVSIASTCERGRCVGVCVVIANRSESDFGRHGLQLLAGSSVHEEG